MSGIRELYDLQEIDRQIDTRNQRLTQIDRDLRGSPKLIAAKTELDVRQAALKMALSQQQTVEDEAGTNQTRMGGLDQRMYAGQGAAPRELQSITSEIANLKQRQSGLDSSALEAMEHTDRARKSLGEQRNIVRDAEAKWSQQNQKLADEREKLQPELSQLQGRRVEQRALVPPPSLKLYDQLRASKKNLAVVKAERGVCLGCRMTIPTTLVQRAKAGKELVRCSSCDRLLFVV